MGNLKEMLLSKAAEASSNWVEENDYALAHVEEIRANTKIILRIKEYMEEHGMKQTELAAKLSVSPQYINKLLHGIDADLKISTAVRYGRILGLNLIEIPEPEVRTQQKLFVTIVPMESYLPNPRNESSNALKENNNSIYYNTFKANIAQALTWTNARKIQHEKLS